VALRRRLEGVEDVAISQSQQTTAVTFTAARHAFSSSAFRSALGEAEVEVLRLEIDVCGVVEAKNGQHWITSAGAQFLLRGHVPASGVLCVTGQLNDQSEPFELGIETALPARFEEH
jgi:hypothetical protein